MKLSEFGYNLPKQLIAQYPSKRRDHSRLLVLHRDTGKIEHKIFKDIVEYLHKDDLLILNNTKVIPARLLGRKETGGRVEALILKSNEGCSMKGEYEVLVKPARGCKVGSRLVFGDGRLKAHIARIDGGRRFLKFECNGNLKKVLGRFGEMPLPPYIKRSPEKFDRDRYQTIYASREGAIAAPTAGLHFTKKILGDISKKGVDIAYITLHVGYGTFKPVRCEDIRKHKMEREYFEVDKEIMEKIGRNKGRTVAVGTTSCRAIETLNQFHLGGGHMSTSEVELVGWSDLFIYPSYKFRTVDALLTNFHLPRTTLLMLVSAFCGRELLFKAYEEAIEKKYRFYSYGDAMLIL